jgi:hypothetical protein
MVVLSFGKIPLEIVAPSILSVPLETSELASSIYDTTQRDGVDIIVSP